jgi:CRISPR type III-A-associated RAMP protein Csm5
MKFTIQTITPIHIGCDETYISGIDFIKESDPINIVDIDKTLRQAGNRIDHVSRAIDDKKIDTIKSFLKFKHSISGQTKIDIKANIRTGFGDLYIPGSSIKGAITSALIFRLIREEPTKAVALLNKNKREFSSKLIENYLGSPKKLSTIGQFIQVSDVLFSNVTATLATATRFNLHKEGNGKKIVPSPVEAIPSFTYSNLHLKVNEQLVSFLNEFDSERTEQFIALGLNSDILREIVSEYTMWLIDFELSLLKQLEVDNKEYVRNLHVLREIVEYVPVLRVGFGQGFTGITGAWLQWLIGNKLITYSVYQEVISYVIKENRWDKKKISISKFPKTRVLEPKMTPLGFLALGEIPKELLEKLSSTSLSQSKSTKTKTEEVVTVDFNSIKDQSIVYAIVIDFKDDYLFFKPLIENLPSKPLFQSFKCRYPAGLPVGSTVKVKVNFRQRKRIQGFNLINPIEFKTNA